MAERPLTAAQLADAIGCFWNAAIGEAKIRPEGVAFACIMAEGMAAIQTRLEEHASASAPDTAERDQAADAAMNELWTRWLAFYQAQHRPALSMADQMAFYEIAQPLLRALARGGA